MCAKNSDSNVRTHIGRVHFKTEYMYPSQLKRKEKNQDNQKSLSNKLDPKSSKELNEAIIECIVEDSRPFGDFRKSGMRKLFEKILPGFVPWHRFTVAKKLKNFYKSYKAELIEFFKFILNISLTTDAWKRKNLEYYFALTAHFFDSEFNFCSLIIGFRKILGRHLGSRLFSLHYSFGKIRVAFILYF